MRKGVSPLIATVILIAITVSLAFIIFSSGKKFITQLSPAPDCSDVVFDAGIYKDGESYTLEVNNLGSEEIEGFNIIITDELTGKSDLEAIPFPVEAGQSLSKAINLKEGILGKELSLVPIVKNLEDKEIACDFKNAQQIAVTTTN